MPSYAAFLGHQPHISAAELSALIPDFSAKKLLGKNVLIFDTAEELSQKQLSTWGGTVLLAKKIETNAVSLQDIPKLLLEQVKDVRGKVTFGIRTFGLQPAAIKPLYRTCKDMLVKQGKSARYIGNERNPAATALLRDSGLVDGKGGREMVILAAEEFFWIGITVAAQDPDAYTERDMEKPVRDTRVGMLPPKLAQVMLNLGLMAVRETTGKIPKTPTVFDPFCGMGVIPIECLVRGWPVLASDASLKSMNGCEKNLDWFRKKHDIKKKDVPSTLWKHDALKPFDLKELPDMVVTETTLGTPLTDTPTSKDAQKLRAACDALECDFLKNAAETLPGVPLVLMFPVWQLRSGMLHLSRVWDMIEKLGYTPILPPGVEKGEHPTLFYRRPDQIVGREIVILKPPAAPKKK